MEPLDKKEIPPASKIFAAAMFNDPLHIWFLPDPTTRLQKLEHLYHFKLKSQWKSAFRVSQNMEGICIWEKPEEQHAAITFSDLYYGLSLLFQVGLVSLWKMIRYQLWSTRLRIKVTNERHWYLNVIVVSPDHQGKGMASKMIKPFLEKASQVGEMAYLETQNVNNVPIYEKYGFVLMESKEIFHTGIFHHCMLKK
ncbi:MAG TPA: GNAT family N-acetyltransferase [Leptospiraceae bacterium]|nr:GNAT family N-acetyltransferase [Leptospiraceae bacterium]